MTKILLFVLFFILISNIYIQATPIVVDENEDIMTILTRLHQETDKLRRRLNPIPDLITFAFTDIADRLKHSVHMKKSKEETDTIYVDFKVGYEEDVETKYVDIYIDTKRDVNTKYRNLNQPSDYVNTKVIYLHVNSASNNKPYLPYPRYRRHRKIH